MNKETLTAKLLDLVEGRETPESWRSWWDEHEPELEALLDEAENEYCAELSDDDLAQVSAAGEAKRIKRRGTDGDGAV
mgnify:CR=1 FL=1